MPNEIASEGTVFVCAACGKRSRDRYGYQAIDQGWDESCMLNSVLCKDQPSIDADGIPTYEPAEIKPHDDRTAMD